MGCSKWMYSKQYGSSSCRWSKLGHCFSKMTTMESASFVFYASDRQSYFTQELSYFNSTLNSCSHQAYKWQLQLRHHWQTKTMTKGWGCRPQTETAGIFFPPPDMQKRKLLIDSTSIVDVQGEYWVPTTYEGRISPVRHHQFMESLTFDFSAEDSVSFPELSQRDKHEKGERVSAGFGWRWMTCLVSSLESWPPWAPPGIWCDVSCPGQQILLLIT